MKLARLILVQGPQVVLLVEIGLTARGLVCFELPVAVGQELPVAQGLDAHIFLPAGGAVAGKGVHVRPVGHHRVDELWDLVDVDTGHGGHNHRPDTGLFDAGDFLQGAVKAARLAEPVVGLPQAVQGELVLLTAVLLQPPAHFVVQVEGVAQNGEGDLIFLHQPQQVPKAGVQDGVAPGEVEVGQAAGFSSGLSPAPQAAPQAEEAFSSPLPLQPNRSFNAILGSSLDFVWESGVSLLPCA